MSEPAPGDLVSFAASRGLLDEATARRKLGEAAVTADRLLEMGLLHAGDLDSLLDAYHQELGATMRLGESASAKCGRCSGRMCRQGDDVVCEPCGVRVTLAAAPLGRLPPEAVEAIKEPANRVGRYVKLRELGHGGFGTVWLAWDTQLSRHVALKFLGGQTSEDRARFRREASLAGTLSHPNIAAVYEVSDEPPYIAMQYIEGSGADKLNASIPEALRVVKAAAEAVQHAHEQGIIHRDLKPQNIMIDKSGRVFVMDFGLAKRTDVESTLSQSGVIAGTPAYMSPEQAEGHVHIDARTDVYSLGVTLYALVSGGPPFTGPAVEILRRVLYEEPPALRLDQDVRTILAKAMEKDPSRRYRTAAELAADIGRYLGGEPIAARPASVAYRIRKKILKNAALSAVAAAAVVIALGAATAITIGAVKRSRERDRDAERYRRTVESAELCRLAMEDVKAGKELWRIKVSKREQWEKLFAGAEAKARQAIERFPDLPGGPYTLGEVEQARGNWEKAAKDFDRAIELDPKMANAWYRRGICELEMHEAALMAELAEGESNEDRRRELEPRKRTASKYLNRYAHLRGAIVAKSPEALLIEARLAYAEGRHEDVLVICNDLLSKTQTDESVWLLKARSLIALKRRPESVATLESLTADVMPQHPVAWCELGDGRAALGHHREAIEDYTIAIDLKPDYAEACFNRGIAKHYLADPQGAIKDLTKAIELKPKFPLAYYNRGVMKGLLGDPRGAIEDYSRAIELRPDDKTAYLNRGGAKGDLGDYRGEIEDCTQAIEIKQDFAMAYNNCGVSKRKLGDYQGAIEDCTKAIEFKQDFAWAHVSRGTAKEDSGDLRGAIEDYTRAIELKPGDSDAFFKRANAKQNLGDNRGAIEDLTKAIELKPDYVEAYVNRGIVKELDDPRGAIEDYSKAIELRSDYAVAYVGRGIAKGVLGDNRGAIEDFTKAMDLKKDFVEAYVNRGIAKDNLGDPRGAIEDYTKAIELKPDGAEVYGYRATSREALGGFKEALDDCLKAVELDPGMKARLEARITQYRKHLDEQGTDY